MPDAKRPQAYLITFTCYGTRLHGSEFGSVRRGRVGKKSKRVPPNAGLKRHEHGIMKQAEFVLDKSRARIAMTAMQETAEYRGWVLFAAHVGFTHVHMVVKSADEPKKIMRDMKSYASRALTRAGYDDSARRRWTRNGSTEYLWDVDDVRRSIDYVLNRQGKPLAVYRNPDTMNLPDSRDRQGAGNSPPEAIVVGPR